MPWCPECKNEYKDGITHCSDCGCELLKEMVERTPLVFGEKEELEDLVKYLEYSKVRDVLLKFDETEEVHELLVNKEDAQHALKLIAVYKQQKLQEALEQMEHSDEEDRESIPVPTIYEDSAAKAEDNKSSAVMLLVVGIVGLVAMILGALDIIPLMFYGSSKYMAIGIMSALFIVFIVMGVVSMKSYRIFAQKAVDEGNITNAMETWCKENLQADVLDTELAFDTDISDEEKYFKRVALLKHKISNQFVNLDEAFLDNFIDEIYAEIFE